MKDLQVVSEIQQLENNFQQGLNEETVWNKVYGTIW